MKKNITTLLLVILINLINTPAMTANNETNGSIKSMEVITLGSGCFWCTEAIFEEVKGVLKVQSGYMGGKVKNPTYREVCSGLTGHAEVVQVTFDPALVSISEILEIFWYTHDPTTLNRQGNDIGTQYRSAVFYHTEEQREIATGIKKKLDESRIWESPIVTEITQASIFYPAEDYHQNYYSLNSQQPYCIYVIKPKLDKFRKAFAEYRTQNEKK